MGLANGASNAASECPTMPRYLVPHHGGLKYVRAIPRDLWELEGRKVWTE